MIYNTVEALNLKKGQASRLKRILMTNLKSELYTHLATKDKEKRDALAKVKDLLTNQEFKQLKVLLRRESNSVWNMCVQHFEEKLTWTIQLPYNKKTTKQFVKTESIDGISMNDKPVEDDQLTSNVRVYGGVQLDTNELAALELPPKFATYNKVSKISILSDIEKCFTKLRWRTHFNLNHNHNHNQNPDTQYMPDYNRCFYDKSDMSFDMKRVYPTNLPFNKRVCMPPYTDAALEAKFTLTKAKILSAFSNYTQRHIQERSINKTHDLNTKIKKGLNILKRRIKNREIVCFPTDKSGRMSVDNIPNYISNMQPHIRDMTETTTLEYIENEKIVNAHMGMWSIILQSEKRTANNFLTTNNEIPPLYGLRKDHKSHTDHILGPPT
ncbi:Hypothetical predicted protein [Octopus vulgaris]|uniref:Uncharacterized protein n=1 Tax=Octopus vulgaris TaxID=6645 RepID=A0AA36B1S6_OCTVU|nr:Hypothetical predicted protein [Octopus vulgaris]